MQKYVKPILAVLALYLLAPVATACDTPATVCSEPSSGAFPLIHKGRPVPVVVDKQADPAVLRVAESFARDLQRVSGGKTAVIKSPKKLKKTAVVIGVLGNNPFIEQWVNQGKLDVIGLAGTWEGFQVSVIDKPWKGMDKALIIVGADRRGAVFGTYDLSQKLGVSPWYWFADVPPERKSSVYITSGTRRDAPKVRYRGIFINDEQPAMQAWAEKKFGGFNADMYEPVFELILRLKGNYIWPAMWENVFHVDDPQNTVLADQMGIVVGTSHHEPMMRAHYEWHQEGSDQGPWDYRKNSENLRAFWRGGIERMMSKGDDKGFDSLVTLGMRGDGDEPMTEGTAITLLESIVQDQRKIIEEVTKKPAKELPQVWALYKEVQEYYDKGMRVPEDVTLLFCDDNWGQIRRLPEKDLDRPGGYGVYYHYNYYGAPRSYKWTNTIQLGKVWQQMNLAWERGARDIWIVNVGDIKPTEYPTEFFMDMAWDPEAMTADAQANYARVWAARTFGEKLADQIASLQNRYDQYSSRRKPELTDRSSFAIGKPTKENLVTGEFYTIVQQWRKLDADMKKLKTKIRPDQADAFFQLLEYPIASYANLYEMYFSAAWNLRLAMSFDTRANYFASQAEQAFAYDKSLTEKYHSINNGKWDEMLKQVHMNYITWTAPTVNSMPQVMRIVGKERRVIFQEQGCAGAHCPLEIEASDFDRSQSGKGLSWQHVENLGQSKAAVIAMPQGRESTTVADGVKLEYDIKVPQNTGLKLTLQLSPSLDTRNQGGLKIAVSIDDGPIKTLSYDLLPTANAAKQEREKAWYKAVIENRQLLKTTFDKIDSGARTLKIWRIDDNVILEKIFIDFTHSS